MRGHKVQPSYTQTWRLPLYIMYFGLGSVWCDVRLGWYRSIDTPAVFLGRQRTRAVSGLSLSLILYNIVAVDLPGWRTWYLVRQQRFSWELRSPWISCRFSTRHYIIYQHFSCTNTSAEQHQPRPRFNSPSSSPCHFSLFFKQYYYDCPELFGRFQGNLRKAVEI